MACKRAASSTGQIIFTLAIICCPFLAAGISTIRPGDQLNSTIFLVSENGNFTLGFFFIEQSETNYLGMWYTTDEQKRKVWVANPNNPILNNRSSVLTMDTRGILKINIGGTTFLNISDQETRGTPIATLEDSGNFAVVDGSEKRTLWQSFDHPNNVLLPGMKLGFNTATKQNWTLTSWVTQSYPASGSFTMNWEPSQDSGQLVLYRRGQRYWTSGLLKDHTFEHFPINTFWSRTNLSLNVNVISNSEEKSLSFVDLSENTFPLRLRPDGGILESSGDIFFNAFGDFCYGYDLNNGCVDFGVPQCRNNKEKFTQKRAEFHPNTARVDVDDNSSINLSDCMDKCWNICDCVGFRVRSNGTGCMTYIGKLEYREDNVVTEPKYVLVRGSSSKGKRKIWIWVVIAVAISVLVLILSTFGYLRMRKRRLEGEEKRRRKEYLQELTASDSFKDVGNGGDQGHDLKIISFASISEATSNFSNENKLGEGGFGPVFKGKLQDGREIAVKRLSKTSGQGLVEFKNELILIAKLQHNNLVRVLACCIHEEEKMLIYEYLPNKSLDFFIFDATKRELLDWKIRRTIIEGIAHGLLYLHKYSRMRVIHRDLKASNVLLDEKMNPKIADFGMARIFKQNETEAMTNRVVGTYGYMSPEYAMEGAFSEKSDVFSFGVLVLEIVSGRRNSSFRRFENRSLNLIGYAWEMWKEGTAPQLKDETLICDSWGENQLLGTIQVGLLCVQEDATDRPTMSEVIPMLSSESIALPAPKQPAFFTGRDQLGTSSSESKSKDCSLNSFTISAMQAR